MWHPFLFKTIDMVVIINVDCQSLILFHFLLFFSTLNFMIAIKNSGLSFYLMTFHVCPLIFWFLSLINRHFINKKIISSLDLWKWFIMLWIFCHNSLDFYFCFGFFCHFVFSFNFSLQFKVWLYLRFDPQCFGF